MIKGHIISNHEVARYSIIRVVMFCNLPLSLISSIIFRKQGKTSVDENGNDEDAAEFNDRNQDEEVSYIYIIFHINLVFYLFAFLCRLRSIAAHRDHFVRRLSVCLSIRLSVCPSVTLAELCFAGDTCIPRNAATIFV